MPTFWDYGPPKKYAQITRGDGVGVVAVETDDNSRKLTDGIVKSFDTRREAETFLRANGFLKLSGEPW